MLLFSLSLELINDVPQITANTWGTKDHNEKGTFIRNQNDCSYTSTIVYYINKS